MLNKTELIDIIKSDKFNIKDIINLQKSLTDVIDSYSYKEEIIYSIKLNNKRIQLIKVIRESNINYVLVVKKLDKGKIIINKEEFESDFMVTFTNMLLMILTTEELLLSLEGKSKTVYIKKYEN
jgi:hypothetical protein